MTSSTSSVSPSSARSRMKVGTAMGLGFALVIVLGVVMALVAWVQLARASAEATLLVEDRMVKVMRANQTIDNLNRDRKSVV